MLTKPSTGEFDVKSLLEAAQISGIQLFVCSDTANICCSGADVSCVEVLVEPGVETVFDGFLLTEGFSHIQSVKSAGGADYQKYLGYCEACATLVQISVFTSIVLASSPGRQLVSRSSSSLFYSTGSIGADQITSAILVVRTICSAAMLYQHQTRLRNSMLRRAQQLFRNGSAAGLHEVAISLCGAEAAKYVVKLAGTNAEWEIDVLLPQLWRELRESTDIEYSRHTPSVLLPSFYSRVARRLTDSKGRVAEAPVLVTLQSCEQREGDESLPNVFQKYLDTCVVRCDQIRHLESDRLNDLVGNNTVEFTIRGACGALYSQIVRYLQTHKIQKTAAGGVLVFVRLSVNPPPVDRYNRSEDHGLLKWSRPFCRAILKCASVLAAKSADGQSNWYYLSVVKPAVSYRERAGHRGEHGCARPATGCPVKGSTVKLPNQSPERDIAEVLKLLSD